MSAERPVNVADMIAWLRAHPGEPFFSLWSKDRLLIGTRSDTGELCAWDCNVQASKMEYDRRASPSPETRTAAAVACVKCLADHAEDCPDARSPETRTTEGAGRKHACACGKVDEASGWVWPRDHHPDGCAGSEKDGEGPRSPSPREGTP